MINRDDPKAFNPFINKSSKMLFLPFACPPIFLVVFYFVKKLVFERYQHAVFKQVL